MAVDPIALSVATVAISTSMGAFYQMLPPISTVRKNSVNDPGFAADVRVGEIAAASIAVGVGAVTSSLAGSAVPIVTSLVMAAGLILLYESTLRSNRPLEQNMGVIANG